MSLKNMADKLSDLAYATGISTLQRLIREMNLFKCDWKDTKARVGHLKEWRQIVIEYYRREIETRAEDLMIFYNDVKEDFNRFFSYAREMSNPFENPELESQSSRQAMISRMKLPSNAMADDFPIEKFGQEWLTHMRPSNVAEELKDLLALQLFRIGTESTAEVQEWE